MASYRTRAFEALLKVGIRSAWRSDVVSVPRIRERVAFMDAVFRKSPRGATVHRVDAGGVPCDWITAYGANTGRVLMYIHGGGFSIHMPRLYASLASDLSARLKARVLLVDYRLAPEHPFPAAPGVRVEDRVWDGMPHVFQAFPFLPEAQEARERACRFLASHTGEGLALTG